MKKYFILQLAIIFICALCVGVQANEMQVDTDTDHIPVVNENLEGWGDANVKTGPVENVQPPLADSLGDIPADIAAPDEIQDVDQDMINNKDEQDPENELEQETDGEKSSEVEKKPGQELKVNVNKLKQEFARQEYQERKQEIKSQVKELKEELKQGEIDKKEFKKELSELKQELKQVKEEYQQKSKVKKEGNVEQPNKDDWKK